MNSCRAIFILTTLPVLTPNIGLRPSRQESVWVNEPLRHQAALICSVDADLREVGYFGKLVQLINQVFAMGCSWALELSVFLAPQPEVDIE